jgi:hypothetical protein
VARGSNGVNMLEDKKHYVEFARRTKSYKWADGLVEIERGINSFLIGWLIILFILPAFDKFPQDPITYYNNSETYMAWVIAFFGVYGIFMVLGPRWRKKLQERLTSERTGYVNYEVVATPSTKNQLIALVFVLGYLVLTIFLAINIVKFQDAFSVVFSFIALLVILGMSWFSYRAGRQLVIPRFYFKAFLELGLGLGLWSFYVFTNNSGYFPAILYAVPIIGIYRVGLGIAVASLGGLTLRGYLRENPVIATSAQEQSYE